MYRNIRKANNVSQIIMAFHMLSIFMIKVWQQIFCILIVYTTHEYTTTVPVFLPVIENWKCKDLSYEKFTSLCVLLELYHNRIYNASGRFHEPQCFLNQEMNFTNEIDHFNYASLNKPRFPRPLLPEQWPFWPKCHQK